jgi:hypothetical protein
VRVALWRPICAVGPRVDTIPAGNGIGRLSPFDNRQTVEFSRSLSSILDRLPYMGIKPIGFGWNCAQRRITNNHIFINRLPPRIAMCGSRRAAGMAVAFFRVVVRAGNRVSEAWRIP